MQRFYLRLFITDFKMRLSRNYKNSRYDILLLSRRYASGHIQIYKYLLNDTYLKGEGLHDDHTKSY